MAKIKKVFVHIWYYIRWPYDWLIFEIKWRKKRREDLKNDPFIYK